MLKGAWTSSVTKPASTGDIDTLADCSDDTYELVVGSNCDVFLVMRQAIPVMLESHR
jgi:hypothetical protein